MWSLPNDLERPTPDMLALLAAAVDDLRLRLRNKQDWREVVCDPPPRQLLGLDNEEFVAALAEVLTLLTDDRPAAPADAWEEATLSVIVDHAHTLATVDADYARDGLPGDPREHERLLRILGRPAGTPIDKQVSEDWRDLFFADRDWELQGLLDAPPERRRQLGIGPGYFTAIPPLPDGRGERVLADFVGRFLPDDEEEGGATRSR